MKKMLLLLAIVIAGTHSVLGADNWPSWRGPNQNAVANGSVYPIEWGEETNIAWKTKVPGWGTSTPAVWGDKIFLTFCEEQNGMLCLGLDGKEVWRTQFSEAVSNRNQKASGANPSAVTDGDFVFGYFRSGEVACVDLDGNLKWKTNTQEKFGEDALWWDLGTSPVLTEKFVVIAVMHQGPSYLVALEKGTGKVAWKVDRDVEAPGEAQDSYTTPLVLSEDGREILVVLGADHVTAHAANDGSEIWRVGNLNPRQQGNFRSIASPVVFDKHVIAPYSRGRTLTGIRLGGQGDVTDSHVTWTIQSTSSDVPSPVGFEGRLYLCSDRGDVTCHDPATGEVLWTEKLQRNRYPFSSSPVLAGGNLYLTREDGTTFVLEVGDTPKLLSTNSVREFTYATPVFVEGRIYMRTSEYVICIANN